MSLTKKILVTGGAGFIGSEFLRQGVQEGYEMVVLDKLTYAGDLKRLNEVRSQIRLFKVDICQATRVNSLIQSIRPQAIVHFAAETHVDRSILNSHPFTQTNIQGTLNLLEAAKANRISRFLHISTDEVYGEIKRGALSEEAPLRPGSPYAASKAAADLMIVSFIRTYKFPAIIIRPSNTYGPWQYPEKLIPVIILRALRNQSVPIYATGQNVRCWLHVSDCVRAIFLILKKGSLGEIYNVGGTTMRKNIETARFILRRLGKPLHLIQYVRDRPGHDWRYAIQSTKIQRLGWQPTIPFSRGIEDTVDWYCLNRWWLESKYQTLQNYWRKIYVSQKGRRL